MAFRARHLVAAASLALLLPHVAWADPTAADKETARTLMSEARSKRDANDLKAALRAFQAADAIMHVPTTGYEVAKTQSMLGMLVEARDAALTIARQPAKPGDPPPFAEARAAAQKLADELEGRIPSIRVVVKNAPENVSVTIDDVVLSSVAIGLPRKLDPGSHAVIAKAGATERRINVQVLEREAKEVPIDFGEPAPPIANTGTSTSTSTNTNTNTNTSTSTSTSADTTAHKGPWLAIGIAGIAIGGVGLAIGAVTGSMSLSQTSTIKSHCASDGTCPATYIDGTTTQDTQAALNGARTLALVSDIAFVAGGVIAATGLVFIVIASTSKSHGTSAELRFGPGSVMLGGHF
jgi:hypothetical protein